MKIKQSEKERKESLKRKAIVRYQESIEKALISNDKSKRKEVEDELILRCKIAMRLGATDAEMKASFAMACNKMNMNVTVL